jgi:WS/DGAT/MGAT family acyltransferase
MTYERLSALDATFLYVESPVAHMHVGSFAIFEDKGLRDEEIDRHIESRLKYVPRFRKKLRWVPFGLDWPVWVDDPHFDVRFHIRHTGLPKPGGEREALRLMSRIMSTPLDRQRPLWEMWVFDMPDNKKALIQKTHHCLIDGVSGVDLGTVLLDLSPDVPASTDVEPWTPEPLPGKGQLLRDSLRERFTVPSGVVRTLRESMQRPRELATRAGDVAKGVLAFSKSSFDWAPKTSLSTPIGAQRRFEVVRADLQLLKSVKNEFRCTVNDVVLATVAGGVGRLLRARGENPDGLVLKAMVPVSVRDPSQRMTYGNKVSMMTADLPVGERDPRKRVEFVRERMAGLKESKQAVGADFWVKLSEYALPTVLSLAGRAAALQRMINIVVTNVPGPQFPLYMCGGRMLEAFPCVPIMGTVSIGIAVLSYCGKLYFGLLGDWDVVPDLRVLADGIEESLAEVAGALPREVRATL